MRLHLFLLTTLVPAFSTGCSRGYRTDLNYTYSVQQTWELDELTQGQIVQFESVFWEPDDTVSLRSLITDDQCATGRNVLEIGTGTGVLSILCLHNGANKVVATDINPAAVANAEYNAATLATDMELDIRTVRKELPGAFSVIKKKERFDLIISNPPWKDGVINSDTDYAFYDPGFALMDSLLDGLPHHLNPGGRCLLAYGHKAAVKRLISQCEARGYKAKLLDDREIDDLDDDFLPGMLIEIRVPNAVKTPK